MVEKVRPVLIFSVPFAINDRAVVTVVFHSTALRGSQFEGRVQVPFLIRVTSRGEQNTRKQPRLASASWREGWRWRFWRCPMAHGRQCSRPAAQSVFRVEQVSVRRTSVSPRHWHKQAVEAGRQASRALVSSRASRQPGPSPGPRCRADCHRQGVVGPPGPRCRGLVTRLRPMGVAGARHACREHYGKAQGSRPLAWSEARSNACCHKAPSGVTGLCEVVSKGGIRLPPACREWILGEDSRLA